LLLPFTKGEQQEGERRGGKLVAHTIPMLGHADGSCHIYLDEDADLKTAIKICVDAKVVFI
jgi:gamma-glutamyl phosphate reductase